MTLLFPNNFFFHLKNKLKIFQHLPAKSSWLLINNWPSDEDQSNHKSYCLKNSLNPQGGYIGTAITIPWVPEGFFFSH